MAAEDSARWWSCAELLTGKAQWVSNDPGTSSRPVTRPGLFVNALVEAPDGSSERWVATSEAQTADRRDGMAIAALAAGSDE
jgi:hypothetical protein